MSMYNTVERQATTHSICQNRRRCSLEPSSFVGIVLPHVHEKVAQRIRPHSLWNDRQ